MATTVDCGEGRHQVCTGRGYTAYLIPQDSRRLDEAPFYCGCQCHHRGLATGGRGVRCSDPECPKIAPPVVPAGGDGEGATPRRRGARP